MAKKRKNDRGYYRATFTFNGKRYVVYSKNQKDLPELIAKKREELKEGKENHDNPTLDQFYKIFNDRREDIGKTKDSTFYSQQKQYNGMRSIEIMKGKVFGEMRIQDITTADIEAVQSALMRRTDPKPLSRHTINDWMNHLKHIFKMAIKWDYIEKNPCRTIESLEETGKPARKTIHRALTKEEVDAFLQGAEERHSYYYPLFVFMLNTGVRVGEAGGITEDEIKDGKVHIIRTVAKNEIGGYCFQKTKTAAGTRDIKLNPEARKAIMMQRQYLAMLNLDKRPVKVVSHNEDKVTHPRKPTLFCSPEGQILREYTANREIARICKAKGIKKFTTHALRDTFATRYNEMYPTRWKDLQKILGHKDANTTLNIYIHPDNEEVDKSMDSFTLWA